MEDGLREQLQEAEHLQRSQRGVEGLPRCMHVRKAQILQHADLRCRSEGLKRAVRAAARAIWRLERGAEAVEPEAVENEVVKQTDQAQEQVTQEAADRDLLGTAWEGAAEKRLDELLDAGLPALQTESGIPFGSINLRRGVSPTETPVTCTAAAGTLLLEFGLLSRLTGDRSLEA